MKIEKTVKYISGLAKQLQQEISMKNNIASSLKNELRTNSNSILENIRNGNNEQATYNDLNTAIPVAAIEKNISVFGADGSSIEADRDLPLEFSAINIGYININYGDKPAAEFDESLTFYPNNKDIPEVDSKLLSDINAMSALRHLLELEFLIKKMSESKSTNIKIGFVDGNLYPNFALSHITNINFKQFIYKRLDEVAEKITNLSKNNTYIISYNSNPNSVHISSKIKGKYASELNDSGIFENLLKTNERSDIFTEISEEETRELNSVSFSFVKNSKELSKIEFLNGSINNEVMNKILAVIISQVEKGKGYPKILIESHEHAVISQSDRAALNTLIEKELNLLNINYKISQKQQSKQTRNI
jgi:hypothetical protein